MKRKILPGLFAVGVSVLLTPGRLHAQAELPDAPDPQNSAPFLANEAGGAGPDADAQGSPAPRQQETRPGFPPVSPEPSNRPFGQPRQHPGIPSAPSPCLRHISTETPKRMSCLYPADSFQRFLDASYLHPLTAKQKGMLAVRNVIDPFNLATIVFISGLSIAADSHTAYGPGFGGFGKNVGVAYTETAVGEFFGTFLIPAIAHQDPHYHRMPNAPIARRIFHSIAQVGWTQSDYGTMMPNYATLVGTAVSDTLGDLYVPGRQSGVGIDTARYLTAIATAPINNFVTEFLPDVASRINLRIVLVQRVIDQVQRENGGG